jgi:D-beta-D-heptose 7-phosphate kinase/D-beta-D-heptose 1-phosphate adenosyltransferase
MKKQIVVAVSGGFDPLHIGHVRMLKRAKKLGDKLVVIINNDHWLRAWKKREPFMPDKERKEIIEAIGCADRVILSSHKKNTDDRSVCKDLEKIKPDIFANGGDRLLHNIPEVATCKKINCKMVFNIGRGGKIQSSSWLLEAYRKT